jgi:hypothetical protein
MGTVIYKTSILAEIANFSGEAQFLGIKTLLRAL